MDATNPATSEQHSSTDRRPIDNTIDALERQDCAPKKSADGWSALCPAHEDKRPSLSIAEGSDGRVLLKCHAGCELGEILAALDLEKKDLFPAQQRKSKVLIVAVYKYTDETGALLYEVVRYEPKNFNQRRPDGKGGHVWNTKGVRSVLYRLPAVAAAVKAGETIYVVEGEKDADNLAQLGLTATTNAMGAGKWRREHTEQLRGARGVVVIPDKDESGRKHADQVARSLRAAGIDVRILELPGTGKDATDWLAAGGSREELEHLAEVAPGNSPEQSADETTVQEGEGAADEPEQGATAPNTPTEKKRSAAQQIVEIALSDGGAGATAQPVDSVTSRRLELFHSADGEPYASFEVSGHRETWAIKSRKFRSFLCHVYFEKTRRPAPAQAVRDATEMLAARALFDGSEKEVHVRIAAQDGVVYLDLCDAAWRIARVDTRGFMLLNRASIKFRRSPGMLALPAPTLGGSASELRNFVNVASDGDWALLAGWLVAALNASGPYPLLCLHGEAGAAKSTCARVLRSLVDPNKAPLRVEPRDPRDLAIGTHNAWAVALDNVSKLSPWLSDGLCRLATGGGFATRQLYTDIDETIIDAQRPVVLTGIEEVAVRGDLADRSITLQLPQIPEERRREEREFWPAFEEARPRMLGAFLSALSRALRDRDHVQLPKLPRMADFAKLAVAAEPALGVDLGTFIAAYAGNRAEANDLTLDSSLVSRPVREFIAEVQLWQGTASEFLDKLNARVGNELQDSKGWPHTPRGLAGALRRIAPNLRHAGYTIEFSREGHSKARTISLGYAKDAAQPSARAASPASDEKPADGRADGADDDTHEPSAENPNDPEHADCADGADGHAGDEEADMGPLFAKRTPPRPNVVNGSKAAAPIIEVRPGETDEQAEARHARQVEDLPDQKEGR